MTISFQFEFIKFLLSFYAVLSFRMFAFVNLVGFAIEDEAFYSCIFRNSFVFERVNFILFEQDKLEIAFIRAVFGCAFEVINIFLCLGLGLMAKLEGFDATSMKICCPFLSLNGLSLLMIVKLLVKLV